MRVAVETPNKVIKSFEMTIHGRSNRAQGAKAQGRSRNTLLGTRIGAESPPLAPISSQNPISPSHGGIFPPTP